MCVLNILSSIFLDVRASDLSISEDPVGILLSVETSLTLSPFKEENRRKLL